MSGFAEKQIPGQVCEVKLAGPTTVVTPTKLFLRTLVYPSVEEIERFVSLETGGGKVLFDIKEIGYWTQQKCALCFCTVSERYTRVEIQDISVAHEQALVHMVDYGKTKWMDIQYLKPLPPQLMKYPKAAMECTLRVPSEWNYLLHLPDFPDRFNAALTNAKTIQCQFASGFRDGKAGILQMWVDNWDLWEFLNPVKMENLAITSSDPPQSGEASPPFPSSSATTSIRHAKTMIEVGSEHEVIVSWFSTPRRLYLQLSQFAEALVRLGDQLQHLSGANNALSQVSVGDVVMAKYPEDMLWYRAEVVQMDGPAEVLVFFFDYGNVSKMPCQELRILPEQFRNFPMQAIPASLDGIFPTLKRPPANPNEYFLQLFPDVEKFRGKFVKKLQGYWMVELESKDGRSVVEALCRDGYVTRNQTPEPQRNVTSPSGPQASQPTSPRRVLLPTPKLPPAPFVKLNTSPKRTFPSTPRPPTNNHPSYPRNSVSPTTKQPILPSPPRMSTPVSPPKQPVNSSPGKTSPLSIPNSPKKAPQNHEECSPTAGLYLPHASDSITTNSKHDVFLSWFENVKVLYLQLVKQEKRQTDMGNRLQIACAEGVESKLLLKPGDFVEGTILAAKFEDDNLWYRAEVVGHHRDTGRLEVFFFDYGNRAEVGLEDVRGLSPEFCQLPKQAIPCLLSQLANTSKAYPDGDPTGYVTNQFPDLFFKATFRTQNSDGFWDVELTSSDGKKLEEQLCSDGFASIVNGGGGEPAAPKIMTPSTKVANSSQVSMSELRNLRDEIKAIPVGKNADDKKTETQRNGSHGETSQISGSQNGVKEPVEVKLVEWVPNLKDFILRLPSPGAVGNIVSPATFEVVPPDSKSWLSSVKGATGLKCFLTGVVPVDGKWSAESIEFFRNAVQDDEMFVTVVHSGEMCAVKLNTSSGDLAELLIEKNFGVRGIVLPAWNPGKYEGFLESIDLDAGFLVFHAEGDRSDLAALSIQLEINLLEEQKMEKVHVGSYCALRTGIEGLKDPKWVRAQVRGEDCDELIVYSVDTCEELVVSKRFVQPLPQGLFYTPSLGVKCVLSWPCPDWASDNDIKSAALKCDLNGYVLEVSPENEFRVFKRLGEDLVDIPTYLMKLRDEAPKILNVATNADYQEMLLPVGSEEECVISHFVDPGEFWVHFSKNAVNLNSLMGRLLEFYGNFEADECWSAIEPGTVCVLQYPDHMYVRGVIQDRSDDPNNTLIWVRAFDYGSQHRVPREFLKKIEPEFLEEPAYSVCCRIQAKPTEDKWSHEAVEAFEQLTHNEGHERKFTVKFHHVQGGDNVRYIVDLFDSDGHSVTDKFVSLGHGIALDESENLDDESWLEVKELY